MDERRDAMRLRYLRDRKFGGFLLFAISKRMLFTKSIGHVYEDSDASHLTEMCTNVQTKNYLPEYNSMHGIKEDATSSWSSYCHQRKLSEHIFSTYMPRHVNGCTEQDKEILKRTILEHEAIFRKQICELHRLYRIQKDLMNEFQARNFNRSSVPAELSYSSSFSSQRWPEYTETISQMSGFPIGVTSWGNMPCAINEKTHLSFKRDRSIHFAQIPFPSGASKKDSEVLDYKPQKRTFDLQLPADVYMDIEGTDGFQKKNIAEPTNDATTPKNGTFYVLPDNGMKLTLQSDEVNHQVTNLTKQIGRSACIMVDLNKPSTKISFESPSNSASNQLLGTKPHNKLQQGYLDRLGDQQTPFHKDVYSKGEWPLNHESGNKGSTVDDFSRFSQASNHNGPTLPERLQSNSNSYCETFQYDHYNPEAWSRQELTHAIQTFPRFHSVTCLNSSMISPSVPSISTSQADLTSCTSSFALPLRNTAACKSSTLVAAHAPSFFSGSAYVNNESLSSNIDAQTPITHCQEWHNRSLNVSVGNVKTLPHTNKMHLNSIPYLNTASYKPDPINNGKENLHDNLPGSPIECSHSRDLKTPLELNLNQALPSVMEDTNTLGQDPMCYDGCYRFPGDASWQKKASISETEEKKTSIVDFSLSNEHPKFIYGSNVVTPNIKKGEKELDLSACNLQEVTSTMPFRDHTMQGDKDSEKNGKRILGFPIDGVERHSSILVSTKYTEKLLAEKAMFMENDDRKFANFLCGTKILSMQKNIQNGDSSTEVCGAMNTANSRPHINLNAELAYADDSTPSELIPEGVVVVRPSHSISIFGAKIVSDPDLQASTSQAETSIINQYKHISSNKADDSEKKDFSCEKLVRLAAENLVAISADCNDCHNDIGSNRLSLPQFDTLCWFAELVSHGSENLVLVDNGRNGYAQSLDVDADHNDAAGGLDLFEAMTLELEEVKVDQQCHEAKETEAKGDEENEQEVKTPASLLFTKARRGQGRKRRQKRDFQKDVLPGLASLSRLEVSEDLQTIGGMLKSSGRRWQTSLLRQNTGQKRMNTQRKGTRQLSMSIAVEEAQVTSCQPSPLSNTELGVVGSSMIGWGRTTRRCSRRRCLPQSFIGPLT
ncbi:uncharacterized protein LOC122034385 isoform X2 [Zingiber officinale]|uniref:uncharacterized protein LOC122034385 isoform X2 n=1 Tax=Zingiber officinale TaxID=94328 RepID=UPI001C4C286D|nr:uncharacterized protein LOC122034385 isoform X2 [Zingiber officinale]